MRIQVLTDNQKITNELESEHGLCIYLETQICKFLLDTGATDLFLTNASKMEIDLQDVDYVFISHGHADHTGGLSKFLEINNKAKVITSEKSFSQKFYSIRKGKRNISIENDFSQYFERFIFVDDYLEICANIRIFNCKNTEFPMPKANSTLMVGDDIEFKVDDFSHELVFTYGQEQLLVYSGCSHKGVINVLNDIKAKTQKQINLLIGGFHLLDDNYETEEEITDIAKYITENYPDTYLLTGHCTGSKAYSILKKTLTNRLNYFYTGVTLVNNKFKIK